jgi:hypothetical protein
MVDKNPIQNRYIVAAILFGMISVLLYLSSILYLQPDNKKHCSDYSSYAEIEEAFKAGNTSLDGNHNGIPCESRK